MIDLNKVNNQKSFILIISTLVIISIALLFISISANEKSKIDTIKNSLIEQSKHHYNSVKEIQLWHTDNLGLYVNSDKIKPNRYLESNQYKNHNVNLIRLSHDKMTKQFSRYAKNFNSFYYKLTSLNPLNKKNLPDEFEKKGLLYLEKNKDKTFFYDDLDKAIEKGTLDLIGALKTEQSCLQCHEAQGYKVGDLKGGIRITIDSTKEQKTIELIKSDFLKIKLLTVLLGLITFVIVYWLINYIFKQKKELETLNNELENKVEKRTKELNDLNLHLEERIKDALKQNEEQANIMIAQSRHAAMGEMISMIAHQWRQPIAVISMGANSVKFDAELGELNIDDTLKEIEAIMEQTEYLTKTIDDFSDFFKPNREKEIIYPEEVIDDAIKMISKTLENNGIKLHTEIEETKKIKTYSRELLQVLINILKNAKEAYDDKKVEDKQITIKLYQKDDTAIIKILDNAGGIPEDVIDSIFDPYFSTKKEKNGTGLGLYMSETIIKKHLKGNLSAQNIDDGVEFIVELNTIKEEN